MTKNTDDKKKVTHLASLAGTLPDEPDIRCRPAKAGDGDLEHDEAAKRRKYVTQGLRVFGSMRIPNGGE